MRAIGPFRILLISIILILHISCSVDSSVQSNENPLEGLTPYEWETSTPGEQGLNSREIEMAKGRMSRTSYFYSFLLIRNGYLVIEEYFNGKNQYSLDPIHSVTKSYISAVIGIAIDEGYIESINSKVLDFFPEYVDENTDPRKFNITIEHLLTMTAGFDEEASIGEDMEQAENMIASIIASDLQFDPGTDFLYSTDGAHLLSGIIEKATGMNTLNFTSENLLKPIGTEVIGWGTDQNGIYLGGAGMFVTPRDMARLGYLYLENGNLEGEQIIPSSWIEQSVTNYLQDSIEWEGIEEVGYGYLWWTGKLRGYQLYFASGLGGQCIMVIPELDMVIVTTMNSATDYSSSHINSLINILYENIIPAVDDD